MIGNILGSLFLLFMSAIINKLFFNNDPPTVIWAIEVIIILGALMQDND